MERDEVNRSQITDEPLIIVINLWPPHRGALCEDRHRTPSVISVHHYKWPGQGLSPFINFIRSNDAANFPTSGTEPNFIKGQPWLCRVLVATHRYISSTRWHWIASGIGGKFYHAWWCCLQEGKIQRHVKSAKPHALMEFIGLITSSHSAVSRRHHVAGNSGIRLSLNMVISGCWEICDWPMKSPF